MKWGQHQSGAHPRAIALSHLSAPNPRNPALPSIRRRSGWTIWTSRAIALIGPTTLTNTRRRVQPYHGQYFYIIITNQLAIYILVYPASLIFTPCVRIYPPPRGVLDSPTLYLASGLLHIHHIGKNWITSADPRLLSFLSTKLVSRPEPVGAS